MSTPPPAAEPSDHDLSVRYRVGDRTAFDMLWRRHSPRFAVLVREQAKKLRVVVSEDILQDAAVKLLRVCEQYSPNDGEWAGWAWVVIRNLCLDVIRKQRKPVVSRPAEVDVEDTSHKSDPDGFADDFLAAMSTLDEQARQVLQDRLVQGLTLQVIAGKLRVSVSTVYRIEQDALSLMRQHLVQKGWGDER